MDEAIALLSDLDHVVVTDTGDLDHTLGRVGVITEIAVGRGLVVAITSHRVVTTVVIDVHHRRAVVVIDVDHVVRS